MRKTRAARRILGALVALIALAAPVWAGGPLIIFDTATQTPYAYPAGPVPVYTDLGGFGPLTNAQADALTANGFSEWSSVPTSYFDGVITGDFSTIGLPDIVGANAALVIGTFNGGGIHVLYDDDASIISGFFGAPPGVLGIASPDFALIGLPDLVESWAVVNGAAVDPADAGGASFGGVVTHEFGHSINLAHTQTSGAVGFFGDADVPSGCPPAPYSGGLTFAGFETMYPFIDPSAGSVGIQMATIDVLDDIASVSNVYPTGGWPGTGGSIAGRVFLPDGTTEVRGVNVIARNLADPYGDAISALSGDFTQSFGDGRFTLNGLTPGATYVLYVDTIVAGGFSTSPVVPLPGPEEYWDAAENGDINLDDPCVSTGITIVAGTTFSADVILNGDPNALPLGDDDFEEVALPFTFPFCGTDYNSVFVGSNGFLTFGSGDIDFTESVGELLNDQPRIAAYWDDLSPNQGGFVTAEEINGDFVVTFDGVPQFIQGDDNTFVITLRSDGSYSVDYVNIDANDGLVGRSPGGGAADPGETDLSAELQPIGIGVETVYELFTNDNDLSGSLLEFAPCSLGAPPQITLSPTSFSETVPDTGTREQTLSVGNAGGQNLHFTAVAAETAPPKPSADTGGVLQPRSLVKGDKAPMPQLAADVVEKREREKRLERAQKRDGLKSPRQNRTSAAWNVPLPHVYAIDLLTEDFNAGIPASWSVVDNEASGVVWALNGDYSEGNYTGGTGDAATCSSDDFGPAPFDTELHTPAISGFGMNTVLSYKVNYQNFGFLDFLDVDISIDGGANWTNVLSWNEDHGSFFGTPGELVALNLDAFLAGASEFIIRWRYYDPNSGNDWDWYAEIDDVAIVSDEPITPCAWLTLDPTSGVIQPGGSDIDVTLTYDGTVVPPGTYDCECIVNSNDPNAERTALPVQMTVVEDQPPTITVTLNRDVLWPPNHKLSDIVATVEVTDDFDPNPTWVLVSITSNEPDDNGGDGTTADDIQGDDVGTADTAYQLRAERSGGGSGRTYTLCYQATDSAGNTTDLCVEVTVPHDQGGNALAATGYVADGTGFDPNAETFAIVVPAMIQPGAYVDMHQVDGERACLGNHITQIAPTSVRLWRVDDDRMADLVVEFPVDATLDLIAQSMAEQDPTPVGFRYEHPDGSGYTMEDILALGDRIEIPERRDDSGPRDDAAPGDTPTKPDILEGRTLPEGVVVSLTRPNEALQTVAYELGKSTRVRLVVYDVKGRRIEQLVNASQSPGRYVVHWNAKRAPNGVYFYRFDRDGDSSTRKFLLLR